MLSKPSVKKIYFLHILTLGFYFFYWCAKSHRDINTSAKQTLVPTTWLLALPGGHYWWMWKYAEALEFVSYKRVKKADTFLLYLICSHAWLLLSFGLQPSVNIGSHHLSHLLILLLFGYIGFCILLQIVGSAFFCATMQNKIDALTKPNTAV